MKPLSILVVCLCVIGAVWHFTTQPTPPTPPAPPTPPQPAPKEKKVEAVPVPEKKPAPVVDFAAPELELTTGRVLYDVVAKSFTETAVSVTHRDGLQIIPYEQFPADVRPALLERKPEPKVVDPKEQARRAAFAAEKERKKAQLEREREEASREREWQERREAARAEMGQHVHGSTARSHAYSYFKTKYDPTGSGTGYLTNLSVHITATEAVSGWDGRYRSKGTASFRLYESAGGSMNQGSRNFEVITEQKDGQCRVIDLTLL